MFISASVFSSAALFASLAMLLFWASTVEASELQMRSHLVVCEAENERVWFWMRVSAGLMVCVVSTTYMLWRGAARVVEAKKNDKRDVCTQSQTTYTALRGNVAPRFLPLPEHSHG